MALLLLASSGVAHAQAFSIDITVNENGNGLFTNTTGFSAALPSGLLPDPGPGGLSSALTYGLLNPPGLTVGDVLLLDGPVSDIIRFNPAQSCFGSTGCLVFYSDNSDIDVPAVLADTGLPGALYANTITLAEGPSGLVNYTPIAGQPGFVSGAAGPVTYHLASDSDVPAPATLVLLASGLTGLGVTTWRRARSR